MRESLLDSVLGCIAGGAIGDAAGASYEGNTMPLLESTLDSASWQITDDTQLTLATCEALAESPNPDPGLIAASLLRWFRSGRLIGLGASTLKALRDLDAGAHWALSGRKGDRAAGNGAAMRIAPLAFCVDPGTDHSRRLIRDVCRITHHHDEAYVGALAVALAVRGATTKDWSLAWIASQLPDTSVRDRLLCYSGLPPEVGIADAARQFGVSGFVVESVPLALFAASRAPALGFVQMLEQVVGAGGDTDTNASLAGQVAGTAFGLSGLPSELVAKLPDEVRRISQAFADAIGQRGP